MGGPSTTHVVPVPVAAHEGAIETYRALSLLEQVSFHVTATIVVGTLVLGLFPLYGTTATGIARRRPVSSFIVGLPITVGLVVGTRFGFTLLESGLWLVVGLPVVIAGLIFTPAWAAIGFVALGRAVSSRVYSDRLWAAVLTGGLIGGLVPLHGILGVGLFVTVVSIGVGSAGRALFTHLTTGIVEERPTPPSEKI